MMVSRHVRTLRTIPSLIASRRVGCAHHRLLLTLTTCLLVLPVQAKYSGGSGTAQDPYRIATAADLIALGETPADYDKHFLLTADIDLDPKLPGRKVFDKAVIAPDTDQTKDWFQGTSFTGVFDGKGHAISHLKVKGTRYLGLFGQLGGWGTDAEVRNLGVVDANIIGSGRYVGGLVGENWLGSISTSYSSGSVSGTGTSVGGLVGSNWSPGSITASYSTGTVSGKDQVGGLVGGNGGPVTGCYSTGTVSGTVEVGGLVGYNGDSVAQCYSTSPVTGNEDVGGLAGSSWGDVTDCYSTGTVGGTVGVGGLVGGNDWGSVAQCYSTSTVTGNEDVGGLAGWSCGDVTDCYSTGAVNGSSSVGGLMGRNGCPDEPSRGHVRNCYSTGTVRGNGPDVGGLVGSDQASSYHLPVKGITTNSFWDIQTSGQATSAGGTGKTTAQMRDPQTFMAAAWDFVGKADGGSDIWAVPKEVGYPILWWQLSPWPSLPTFSGGTGEPNDPYRISTAKDLNSIGYNPRLMQCHFKLVADLDLTGVPFCPIGWISCPYGGVFDGMGHAISHLTIKGGDCVGLFGQLAPGGQVRNLGILDVNVVASGEFVGGLVGSGGAVTACYSTGRVSGDQRVGGLVGGLGGSATDSYSTATVSGGNAVGGLAGSSFGDVTDCYSTGAVSGKSSVGGLVALNSGAVTACYSTGRVSGDSCVGGLVGWNDGTVAQCYTTGTVTGNTIVGGLVGRLGPYARTTCRCYVTQCYSAGAVSGKSGVGGLVGQKSAQGAATGCFWDIQTSGQSQSAGGTGTTTAQMQTAKTFLDAAWGFVGETKNGTEDIWWILEGKDYPRLAWEFRAFAPDPPNGATDVIVSPTLSWFAARTATVHAVYFGQDQAAVASATPGSVGIYRGRQPRGTTTYDPGNLLFGKTYYWRIDEVNERTPTSPWRGTVWSFTTVDFIVVSIVDDFESYTHDEGSRIYQAWIDGLGPEPNVPGNGTGSVVGNGFHAEQTIVHGGKQSMPMDYNDVKKPWYSEAERTWQPAQDWTTGGADTLTLYFRGEPNNSPEPLYARIEDNAGRMTVVVQADAGAVRRTQWQKWYIAFADVRAAGVDVAAVQKMVIGVGDRENPKPGGTGRIYIDDIRLTKRRP